MLKGRKTVFFFFCVLPGANELAWMCCSIVFVVIFMSDPLKLSDLRGMDLGLELLSN